jgi:hypothetical protein
MDRSLQSHRMARLPDTETKGLKQTNDQRASISRFQKLLLTWLANKFPPYLSVIYRKDGP